MMKLTLPWPWGNIRKSYDTLYYSPDAVSESTRDLASFERAAAGRNASPDHTVDDCTEIVHAKDPQRRDSRAALRFGDRTPSE